MPSPNLIASALSQKTKKIKIGVLGNILPLRNHPVRVAEEYAMIDCLSNGRLIAGFVRGIPPEYIWYGVNPAESRGRFQEAYDLIMTAWTQSVWSFEGEFFKLKDCAIWPRPVQQPHPPIWIAARSAESIEWCVKRHLTCAQVYQTTGQIEDTFGYYRTKANEDGWHAGPDKFILCRHIYIDESEQKAREFGDPAMRYFFTVFNRGFNEAINKGAVDQKLTAALTSERSFSYFREGNRERHDFSKLDWQGLIDSGYLIAGNPDSVAKQIQSQMKQIGADHFMGMFHIGNLAHDKVVNSLNLFKKEIMPRLQ
jgi:alkanesulfonate monooxygenase SsuD/methylene tetrahydromethanopterin reductase-like flavin-dependent oxidoreductase (luciferase family)